MAVPHTIKTQPKYSQALKIESHLQITFSFVVFQAGKQKPSEGSDLFIVLFFPNLTVHPLEIKTPCLSSWEEWLCIMFPVIEIY